MASAHMIFDVNQIKIKGGCQSGRKGVPHDSKSDLPLKYKTKGVKFPFKKKQKEIPYVPIRDHTGLGK